LDNYEIREKIGTGSYAVVKLAVDKRNNEKVAIKIYEKVKLLDP
jgi:serine/threonine protein kinase